MIVVINCFWPDSYLYETLGRGRGVRVPRDCMVGRRSIVDAEPVTDSLEGLN